MIHFCYAEADASARMSEIRETLQIALRAVTGRDVKVAPAASDASVLVPVITPHFFDDEACLEALARFEGREGAVWPIYWRSDPAFETGEDAPRRSIGAHQGLDWRRFADEPGLSEDLHVEIVELATLIAEQGPDAAPPPSAAPLNAVGAPNIHTPAPPGPLTAEKEAAAPIPPTPAPAPQGGGGKRTGILVLLALAAAALVLLWLV